METVKVSRGKQFLKKGDRLKGLYIILQGSVRAVSENDEFDMEAGSIIGMLESLSGTCACNYMANTDCMFYAFPYNSPEDYKKIFAGEENMWQCLPWQPCTRLPCLCAGICSAAENARNIINF